MKEFKLRINDFPLVFTVNPILLFYLCEIYNQSKMKKNERLKN